MQVLRTSRNVGANTAHSLPGYFSAWRTSHVEPTIDLPNPRPESSSQMLYASSPPRHPHR